MATMADKNGIDELAKKRLQRELEVVGDASAKVGDVVLATLDQLGHGHERSIDAIKEALIDAGLPEESVDMIGVPLSLLTQGATHLYAIGMSDDQIKRVLQDGVPRVVCTCDDPLCSRSPRRVRQTLRLISYAVDELGVLVNGEPSDDIDDDELQEFVGGAVNVANAMLEIIVDASMHSAFAWH